MIYNLDPAITALKDGKIMLCPTDTVWGISCDATNAEAVDKIIALKNRDENKSFIVLVNSLDMLGLYVDEFPNFAVDIIEFSEQPITVIFPKGVKLAPGVINEDGSVAIRWVKPQHEESKYCNALISKFRRPIVSTSANISGEPTPIFFNDIQPSIKDNVDFVVPYFQQNKISRKPSRIIKLNVDGTFKVIR